MLNLALMYDVGQGVPRDDAQAVSWYQRAAEKGLAQACNNLAAKYGQRKGVAKNRTRAYLWLLLASEAPDRGEQEPTRADAGKTAAAYAELLTPEERKAAEELARSFPRGDWHATNRTPVVAEKRSIDLVYPARREFECGASRLPLPALPTRQRGWVGAQAVVVRC